MRKTWGPPFAPWLVAALESSNARARSFPLFFFAVSLCLLDISVCDGFGGHVLVLSVMSFGFGRRSDESEVVVVVVVVAGATAAAAAAPVVACREH